MTYIPSTKAEQQEMLKAIGKNNISELFDIIPKNLQLNRPFNIPEGKSEFEVMNMMESIASENIRYKSIFRGAGAYKHLIPGVVNHLAGRSEFVTAYTPYQAELNQGVLTAIFEYQTTICALTGMDASNASVYDGASGAAEALSMCRERNRNKAVVSEAINPQTMTVIKTYCYALGIDLVTIPSDNGVTDINSLKNALDKSTMGVYLENPNFFGLLEPAEKIAEMAHEVSAKAILGVNPIALGLLKNPAEMGFDIAVGEAQPLGIPLSFGGPYVGFLASKKDVMRKLPGRIVGESVDGEGRRAFVLTLQAREQHIRREKASSSICSNQALCALRATIYSAAMGPSGLRDVASQCVSKAHYLASELSKISGFSLKYKGEFFHEFVTNCTVDVSKLMVALREKGILGGLPLAANEILWCVTEANTKEEIDTLVKVVKEVSANV